MSARSSSRVETLTSILPQIERGERRPVYVLHGDEYLCHTAAQELVQALVPEAQRALNLVLLDAAVSAGRVAEELSTVPMFRGTKAVLVEPAEFLAPRKATGNPFEKVRKLWEAGKTKEAVRRLLGLAGRAGFELEGLQHRSREEWREAGFPLTAADLSIASAAAEIAQSDGLEIPDSDTRALEELLRRGLPAQHHLIVVVEEFDRNTSLAKACLATGIEIPRLFSNDGSGGKTPTELHNLSAEVLQPLGKRLAPDAQRLLLERVGDDARRMASELAKLAAYAGSESVIRREDVLELVPDQAGEDLFALSNALEGRDGAALTRVLDDELERGAPPLKILAGLASAVRGLLLTRAELSALGTEKRMSFPEFERRVLPTLVEAERRSGRRPSHPFRAYKRAEAALRFGLQELTETLILIADADISIKRGTNGELWLQRIVTRVAGV